jgi:hypothetical protein
VAVIAAVIAVMIAAVVAAMGEGVIVAWFVDPEIDPPGADWLFPAS